MKKYLLLLFTMLLPLVASAYDAKIDGIYYNFNGDNATVTYRYYNSSENSTAYTGAVIIPESVTYNNKTYSVTSIGEYAFYNCSSLTSITIPNSVTRISYYAFYGCSGLTSVNIPNSVTSIGSWAFYYCTGLTSVNIPNSVTSIGTWAFCGCSGLTSITIPNSVTSIGNDAFYGCSSLTSVNIPNSVTSIGESAFYNCSSLTSITIPNSVTSIGNDAFRNCRGLTSIIIPNSVTSIGYDAFNNCSSLTSVTIPVDDLATFCNNKIVSLISNRIGKPIKLIDSEGIEITDYIIPNGVTSIGESAFYNCSSLTSITIPNSVTSISNSAFSSTNINKVIWLTNTPPNGYKNVKGAINYVANNQYSSLSNVKVYPYLSSMFEVDGVKYVPVSPSERTCDAIDCANNETAKNLNVASSVTYQGITLNVKKVMPYFACGNNNIETLSLDIEGDISMQAFYNCTNIKSVNLGEKITGIGSSTFYGCSALETIQIPDAVKTIGDEAFRNCTGAKTAVIGNGCTQIGKYAFSGCTSMQSAVIGNGCTQIDQFAFSGCTSMQSVSLGSALETIGEYAFSSCESLQALTIPKSVRYIYNYALSGCKGLKKVVIEDRETVLSLGSNGSNPFFFDCPLDEVYIGGNISYSTGGSYGYSPFYRNSSLRSVTFTDKETEISDYEFYGCSNLQNVIIGNGVTSIDKYAFSGCQSLKSFSFGTQVRTIGQEAFSDCTAMEQITSKAQTPPTCGSQALDDINKWTCRLYVPEGKLATYQAADQWKDFFFVQEGEGGGADPNPGTEKCATPTISYANGKLTFNSDTEEVVFHSSITDSDITSYLTQEIELGVTYTISVYATRAGYIDSDVATGTLCWIEQQPATENITDEDAVTEVKAVPVLIQTQGGNITIQGATEGTPIAVYDIGGKQYGSTIAGKDRTNITTSLQPGSVAIVKIGEKAIKVLLK